MGSVKTGKNSSVSLISKREQRLLAIVFTFTSAFFALGIFLPILTTTKLFVFSNTVSIVSGVFQLAAAGSWFLFAAICGFSIVMPVLKLRLIYVLLSEKGQITQKTRKWLKLMHDYGRWGMLDVFIVAVLLVSVKLGELANVKLQSGLYFFGVSVLLMMAITHRLSSIYSESEPNNIMENDAD